VLFQLGWIFQDLCSREQHYIYDFVRDGLHLTWPLLDKIEPDDSEPDDDEVVACFSAHQHAASVSESGSRYFYKRYRTHLLRKMDRSRSAAVGREVSSFLEQLSDGHYDGLEGAARFAPSRVQHLFPHAIARNLLPAPEVAAHLANTTDRRLWLHTVMGKEDERAARTLNRIVTLEQAPIFRPLPAETLLELGHSLCRVLIAEGDPIILEGRANDDIYVLTEGRLSVSKRRGSTDVTLGFISPGEVFGEMAFLTRHLRSATVRAVEASECIMVKSADMRLLAYRQPSVVLQIARVLAERLEATDL